MVQTQTKEDKDSFFAKLETLGTEASETESDGDELLYYNSKTKSFNHNRVPKFRPSINQPQIINKGITSLQSGLINKVRTTTRTPQPEHNLAQVVIDLTSPDATINPTARAQTRSSSRNVNSRSTSITKPAVSDDTTGVGKKQSRHESSAGPPKKKAKKNKYEVVMKPENQRVFKNLVFFFIPNDNIGMQRKIRIQRAQEYGATHTTKFDETVTHVVVEPHIEYSEIWKAFPNQEVPDGIIVVNFKWFSECIEGLWLREADQFRFKLKGQPRTATDNPGWQPVTPTRTSPRRLSRFDVTPRKHDSASPELSKEFESIIAEVKARGPSPSEGEEFGEGASFSGPVSETGHLSDTEANDNDQPNASRGFQCLEAHTGSHGGSPNAKTIAVLKEMASYYDRTGDHWRTTAYRKAISALRRQTALVATAQQAEQIPQVGSRIAEKIDEIVSTNRLRRLENAKEDPHDAVLQLFMGIYDVGHKQASEWIAQGHRTLADLLNKVEITANQRIGIEHYKDFQERIPSWEVSQHGSVVRHALKAVDTKMDVIIGGSFRRGSRDSGDIDLIITKQGADLTYIRNLMNTEVIPALTKAGFLKCTLASSHASSSTSSKWLGASCLPTTKTWRRIDLLYVPGNELGAALIYFTGNDIFNRSIRLLASKKGMRLNQHGLYKDVMRGEGRKRITDGTLVESKDERKIFQILGVPWRQPHERIC